MRVLGWQFQRQGQGHLSRYILLSFFVQSLVLQLTLEPLHKSPALVFYSALRNCHNAGPKRDINVSSYGSGGQKSKMGFMPSSQGMDRAGSFWRSSWPFLLLGPPAFTGPNLHLCPQLTFSDSDLPLPSYGDLCDLGLSPI